jgi:beta-galactosidase
MTGTTEIGYDRRAVIINGRRTLLLSGAIHYPRSTPEMWDTMMAESKAAGLNAIETYVFWNFHERERGVFDFSDRLDLRRFCETAQKHDLYVILRIGPYICAEINYGGFPAWLRDVPGIQIRTLNEPYMREKERWVRLLCDYLRPMFAPQGGPIIMAQIENEYNLIAPTYGEDGQRYLAWSIELGQSLNLGVPWVMCVGGMPGAIETLNGFYRHEQIAEHRAAHPDQPALWTEHWTGWYDLWGQPHHARTPEAVAYGAARFVAGGGTGINYYMWHGGTNFGREAMFLQTTSYDYSAPLDEYGLVTTKSRHLGRLHRALLRHADELLAHEEQAPQPLGAAQSAYVYGGLVFLCNDDPEAAATVAYGGASYTLAPRSVQLLSGGAVVFNSALVFPEDVVGRVMRPGVASLSAWSQWSEPLPAARPDAPVRVASPVEQLQLTRDESDYCWYSASLTAASGGPAELTLTAAADYMYIYIDGALAAHGPSRLDENRSRTDDDLETLMRALEMRYEGAPPSGNPHSFRHTFTVDLTPGEHRLDILCAAVGMIKGDWQIGFANMADERKGLWGAVELNGAPLAGAWELRAFLAGERYGIYGPAAPLTPWAAAQPQTRPLTWLRATFARPVGDAPLALDLGSMGKGMAWLNGRCIGRYWLVPGDQPHDPWFTGVVDVVDPGQPTQRYYHLPSAWLREENELVLLEEQGGAVGDIAYRDGEPPTSCRRLWSWERCMACDMLVMMVTYRAYQDDHTF